MHTSPTIRQAMATKKIQKLKKKLKQVEELEKKVADGLAPSAEQREKLARKTALVDELAAVEARL